MPKLARLLPDYIRLNTQSIPIGRMPDQPFAQITGAIAEVIKDRFTQIKCVLVGWNLSVCQNTVLEIDPF